MQRVAEAAILHLDHAHLAWEHQEALRRTNEELERRVAERTAALERANAEAEVARAAAEQANRTKSEFLASMSHELRTPLNAILGFAEVLTDPEVEVDAETQHQFVLDIHTAGKHLVELISDILDLSKAEAGKMEFYPEDFVVEPTVRGVQAVARALVERKRQVFQVTVDPAAGTVHQDPARFKQVLFNLISNAVKFTPIRGSITVVVRRDDDGWLEVAVSDTGVGMKLEDQQRVFEEFQQIASGDSREQQGTGLGLTLVRRFVHIMGGEIWVTSAPGEGSCFTFRIPSAAPETGPGTVDRRHRCAHSHNR